MNQDDIKRLAEDALSSASVLAAYEKRMDEAIDSILTTGSYENVENGIKLNVELKSTGEIVTAVTAVQSGDQVE